MSRFDSLYNIYSFPYNAEMILKRKPDEIRGGSFEQSNSILYFLNNYVYSIMEIYYIINGERFNYSFEINYNLNKNKMKLNSYYLSNGYYSTAIGIKCTSHPELGDLVFKLIFVKNQPEERIKKWNDGFYMLYRREKRWFGNIMAECYFYGNKIYKEEYEQKIINESHDKPEEYDELFKNKHLAFSIYKYYSPINKIEYNIQKNILLKLSILLYYFCMKNLYIYDLKYDNVCINKDENNNIIFIDYDRSTFTNYRVYNKGNYKYKIWKHINLSFHLSCYLKKNMNLIINLESEETKSKIIKMMSEDTSTYSMDPEINNMYKNGKCVHSLLINALNAQVHSAQSDYYLTDYNLYFEKFNVISIVDIILGIFFKEINFGGLLYEENIKTSYGNFNLNRINFNRPYIYTSSILSFHNINDIDLLTRFIYEFIQPNDSVEPEYIVALKLLILDPVTETGLLGTDFESVPTYENIAKKFKDINKDDTPIYDQFKQMIDDNIGTPRVKQKENIYYKRELNDNYKITNVGNDVKAVLTDLGLLNERFDTIIYEEWQLSVLVEKIMNRPENRSDTSLNLPCVNSTLPQNYIFTINKISGETTKTIKWAKNDEEIYVDTPEYKIIKDQLSRGECTLVKTKRHEELEKTNERIFARCIVSFLKGTPIISEGLTGYLLEKVALLRPYDREKYIILATIQKPVKKIIKELEPLYSKKQRQDIQQSKISIPQGQWERGLQPSETMRQGIKSLKTSIPHELWKRGLQLPIKPFEKSISEIDSTSIIAARDKYLKYKNKYLKLKNKIDI